MRIMKHLTFAVIAYFAMQLLLLDKSYAIEGVCGTVVRPRMTPAKIAGCRIGNPGAYQVRKGDLIEIDYDYPVIPGSIPSKVSVALPSGSGAVVPSDDGVRSIETPELLGSGAVAFYFRAAKEGTQAVNVIIDGETYKYEFSVARVETPENQSKIRQQSVFQVDPLKLRIKGDESFQVHRLELSADLADAASESDQPKANGKLVCYGKCDSTAGVSHWGDCNSVAPSISIDVRVVRRYETDPSGLNRQGFVIHRISGKALEPVDADGKVLFLNGPPQSHSGGLCSECPWRLVINTKSQDEIVDCITLEPMALMKASGKASSAPPSGELPAPDPKRPFFPLVYLYERSSCDLARGELNLYLADFPKALIFRVRAENIAADADFYYCREQFFGKEWAFAKFPEDNFFIERSIWNRDPGAEWKEVTAKAVLASPR